MSKPTYWEIARRALARFEAEAQQQLTHDGEREAIQWAESGPPEELDKALDNAMGEWGELTGLKAMSPVPIGTPTAGRVPSSIDAPSDIPHASATPTSMAATPCRKLTGTNLADPADGAAECDVGHAGSDVFDLRRAAGAG